jgi:hypothetical protein
MPKRINAFERLIGSTQSHDIQLSCNNNFDIDDPEQEKTEIIN